MWVKDPTTCTKASMAAIKLTVTRVPAARLKSRYALEGRNRDR